VKHLDKKPKILIIDDAVDTQLLLQFDLVQAGFEVFTTSSGQEGIDFFEIQSVDLILLDLIMPGISGLETLSILKSLQVSKSTPVIMLSSSIDEDSIVKALDLGADDYVVKPYIARVLLARIRTSLRAKENNLKLEKLAKTDYLTGINNKGNFISLATKSLSLAKRSKSQIIVAMLDIDFFKVINDKFGHHVGDLCLIAFTRCLKTSFRDYDVLGRVGGEEFAVCLPNTSIKEAFIVFERFRASIEKLHIPTEVDEKSVKMTVSIGLSSTETADFDITNLLKQADKGLYFAKQNGRNQVCNGDELPAGHDSGEALQPIISMPMDSKQPEDFHCREFPGINFSAGLDNVLGIESLYREMLILFYTEHHNDGVNIEEAILDKNILKIRRISHKLKDVSNSIGAIKLFSLSQQFDIKVNEEGLNNLTILFDSLKKELSIVLQGINKNLLEETATGN
jgi:diguanylate cyclase (GGDEF)-like protein